MRKERRGRRSEIGGNEGIPMVGEGGRGENREGRRGEGGGRTERGGGRDVTSLLLTIPASYFSNIVYENVGPSIFELLPLHVIPQLHFTVTGRHLQQSTGKKK